MEFDAVLLPARRAPMIAQGLWHAVCQPHAFTHGPELTESGFRVWLRQFFHLVFDPGIGRDRCRSVFMDLKCSA